MNQHSKAKALLILSGFFAIVICSFWSTRINAAVTDFQEGKQYKKFSNTTYDAAVVEDLMKKNVDKVKVMVFYNYACHWCQELEPKVASWSKNLSKDTLLYHVPVSFQPGWRSLAKMYFAAEQLNVVDKIHAPLFEAVKKEELANTKDETILAFVGKQGIDKKAFNQAYHSFATENKTRWANNLAVSFKITAIPTFVVVGPKEAYYTQTGLAGDETRLFEVLTFLVQKQQQQIKKS